SRHPRADVNAILPAPYSRRHRRKGFEHPGRLSVPAYGPTRTVPVPPDGNGRPSLRTTRGDRGPDPRRPLAPAHPPRRAERGREEHDDPDAGRFHPGGSLL